MVKFVKQSLFVAICLISLANCRRGGGGPMGDGPMGGGPMGEAGPCPRCNQLRENEFARNRDGLEAAPFPSANGADSSILDEVDPNLGQIPVQPENIAGNGSILSEPDISESSVDSTGILGGGPEQTLQPQATFNPARTPDRLRGQVSSEQFLREPATTHK